MSNDLGVPDHDLDKFDSGMDFSSFGSSESEVDLEHSQQLDDKTETNKYFKEKTPKISNQVLDFNQFSSDESDSSIFDNYSPIKPSQNQEKPSRKSLMSSKDVTITPKTRRAKSLIVDSSTPHIVQAKQQLQKLMKRLESKSEQKSAELEKVNQQLQSHSAELNKYNLEIEEKLLELQRARDQLHRFVEESSESRSMSSKNSSLTEDEIRNNSFNQPFDKQGNNNNGFDNNIIVRGFLAPESPTNAKNTNDEIINTGSPEFKNIYQQLEHANSQLAKLQNQLQQLFDIFNLQNGNKNNMSDSDFAKLISKIKKDKELADSIKSNNPGFEPVNIISRSIKLDPEDSSHELEKARNQLQRFYDIFNPDGNKKRKEDFTDEDFEKLLNQAKNDKNLSKAVEKVFPANSSVSQAFNIDEIASQINDLRLKSNELDEIQNQLRDANEQLNSKSTDLDQANQKLEDVCKILEAIEGKKINPDQITNEKLANIIEKVKSTSDDSDISERADQSKDRMRIIAEIFNKSEDLNDEEFDELVETLRKNKELSETLLPSLPDDFLTTADFQDKIHDLELKSAEFDKIKQQLGTLIKLINDTDEEIDPDEITYDKLAECIKKLKKLKKYSKYFQSMADTLKLGTEKLREFLKQSQADLDKTRNQLASLIQASNLDDSGINNPFLQDGFYDDAQIDEFIKKASRRNGQQIKARSIQLNNYDNNNENSNSSLCQVQNQLDEFLNIFGEIENQGQELHFEDILENARKGKELADAVRKTLPSHSSCGEEAQVAINILKLRSKELDNLMNKIKAIQLRKKLDYLTNSIGPIPQPNNQEENDELRQNDEQTLLTTDYYY